MNSKATITSLGDDLDGYVDSNFSSQVPVMDTEYDFKSVESLANEGKKLPGIRLGLFEQPEEVLSRVEANSAYDLNQAYLLQLFFPVARIGDYDTLVEFELLDLKDVVYDWAFDIDAGTVTSNELVTFEWGSIIRIERRDRYSLLEIIFGAFRQTRL